jgi:hypothetical protein
MRVADGPFPHFELIDESDAPLLNLKLDDFLAVFSFKKRPATGVFTIP